MDSRQAENQQVEPPPPPSPTPQPHHSVSQSTSSTTSIQKPVTRSMDETDPIEPISVSGSSLEEGRSSSSDDPYMLKGYIRDTVQTKFTQQVVPTRAGRKQRKVKKYYNRQNALIDAYLGSGEEEQFEIDDAIKNGGKVKFAVNASFVCNFCLFIIQMYAAISTGSLSLFATAADAFVSPPPERPRSR